MEIIIAYNDQETGKIIADRMSPAGHEVIFAENDVQVWEILNTKKARILILDWILSGLESPDICRKIRAEKWPNYLYIILLISKDKKSEAEKGLEAGADDYVTKPIHYEDLLARIRSGMRIIQLEENHRAMNAKLLQSDKMASIGQLAAGVAHEINNPTGFISSNLTTLNGYQQDIGMLINEYRNIVKILNENKIKDEMKSPEHDRIEKILEMEKEIDIDFILDDMPKLIGECIEGTKRIKQIVIDLKDFAHPGESEIKYADLNKNMDSTLNIVWNEIKYKATVNKDYGELPLMSCYPQQLNQVFMNILVNAAQAMSKQGVINISSRVEDKHIKITISDTGCGIPAENISKIFNPFFTTKEVGKGTGLGLNVAYNIIKKHNGTIEVKSNPGEGSSFIISLPVDGINGDSSGIENGQN